LFRNLADRLHHSGLIVDVLDGDEERIPTHRCRDCRRIHPAPRRGLDEREIESSLFERLERFEDGAMFDAGADQVSLSGSDAGIRQSEEGKIVAFGGSTGENDVSTIGAGYRGDLIARQFHGSAGRGSVRMASAPGISEVLLQVSHAHLKHARVDWSSGRAIQVNRHLILLQWPECWARVKECTSWTERFLRRKRTWPLTRVFWERVGRRFGFGKVSFRLWFSDDPEERKKKLTVPLANGRQFRFCAGHRAAELCCRGPAA
jgi:hypothetical protein